MNTCTCVHHVVSVLTDLQACNARDDDDDVASPDAPGEDQVGILFNEDDDSDPESEDDGWFENMIEQNLAGYVSAPACDNANDIFMGDPGINDTLVMDDSQDDWQDEPQEDPHEFPATQVVPDSPPVDSQPPIDVGKVDGFALDARPVARPLQTEFTRVAGDVSIFGENTETVMVDDSPKGSASSSHVGAQAMSKEERMTMLRGQLRQLEDQMKAIEWGPLFLIHR